MIPRAYAKATMSMGAILGMDHGPLTLCNHLMGSLLQSSTCQIKYKSGNRAPGQGYLIARPSAVSCGLVMRATPALKRRVPGSPLNKDSLLPPCHTRPARRHHRRRLTGVYFSVSWQLRTTLTCLTGHARRRRNPTYHLSMHILRARYHIFSIVKNRIPVDPSLGVRTNIPGIAKYGT